jgi:hypothetical protein
VEAAIGEAPARLSTTVDAIQPDVAPRDFPDEAPGRYPGWQDDRLGLPMRGVRHRRHALHSGIRGDCIAGS